MSNNESLLAELYDQNPWWSVPQYRLPAGRFAARREKESLVEMSRRRQVLAITGLRRVGKTILMQQLLDDRLEAARRTGEDLRHYLFFSFDSALQARHPRVLEDLLGLYCERLLGKKHWDLEQEIFFFLDEIQLLPYWQDVVKRWYDRTPRIRWIVSGSTSLLFRSASRESLAGRLVEKALFPLDFSAFLTLRQEEVRIGRVDPFEVSIAQLRDQEQRVLPRLEVLLGFFDRYLIAGGFPELLHEEDYGFTREYLRQSVLEKVLGVDLPRLYGLRRADALPLLMKAAAAQSGQLLEFNSLSRDFGLDRETVAGHFAILEQAFLLALLYNHTGSVVKQLRTAKKVFPTHPNLTTALLELSPQHPLWPQVRGQLVETYVRSVLAPQSEGLQFYRQKTSEIDFVAARGDRLLPVEVKFQTRIRPADLNIVANFMERKGLERGVVLSRTQVECVRVDGGEILIFPAWWL